MHLNISRLHISQLSLANSERFLYKHALSSLQRFDDKARVRIEVFAAGRVLQLDNFRKLKGYGWPGFNKLNLWRQDKGQNACAAAFLQAVQKGVPAIPVEEIFEVARMTIDVAEQLRKQ